MKTVLICALALPVLLAACNNEPTYAEKEATWSLAAQDVVRSQLRDADSAEFRDLFVEHWGGAPVLCGEVNARNGFGGFSGHQRFYYRDGTPLGMEGAVPAEQFAGDWYKYCNRRS